MATNMEITEETMAGLVSTVEGRVKVLSHLNVTEGAAVVVLNNILEDLSDQRILKMATRHRDDEIKHEAMLAGRLKAYGVTDVPERTDKFAALVDMWREMNPQNSADKYSVLRVVEENDAPDFSRLSSAVRPYDPESADVFSEIAADEANHLRYCDAALRALGGRPRLREYREIYHHRIELYDRQKHFAEISSWGEPLDPDAIGTGLVIPGRCCGFVGVVGGTRTAYFYGLRANPAIGRIARGLSILRLARRILADVKQAGLTRCVTSTANPVVERFWVERAGLTVTNEKLLEGVI